MGIEGFDNLKPEHDHKPVQHRDGKPPWCKLCGLTADGKTPISRFDKKESKK